MNDWLTNALICLAMMGVALILIMLGYSAEQAAWRKDCEALGKHRSEGVVYVCAVEGKAQ